MSAIKHTPEPWKYGVRRDGSIWISRGDPQTGPHYQADFCGTQQDARLTCAAPQMLGALIAIISAAELYGTSGFDFFEARNAAIAAIAKAEGR